MWDVFIAPLVAVAVSIVIGKLVWKHKITKFEIIISIFLSTLASIGIYYALVFASLQSVELWNGIVEDKGRVRVSCEHGYEVCTGSGDNKRCHTEYEHSYDYNWVVYSSVGDIEIERVDWQGVTTPPRFHRVVIGEPATTSHYYTDYVKGNTSSIFHVDASVADRWEDDLHEYPIIYDYYRVNRSLNIDEDLVDISNQFNMYLNDALRVLGDTHQVNIISVFTKHPESYFTAQMAKWEGGRKNDVILFYGVKDNKVKWFRSTSTFGGFGNGALHSLLRQQMIGQDLNIQLAKQAVETIRSKFVRNPMESNKYMLLSYEAPWWVILLSILLSSATSIGLSVFMSKYDVTYRGIQRSK